MKELIKNKKFLAVYSAWILIHTFLLFQGKYSYGYAKEFWPFTSTDLGAYDFSEWLGYVFSPLVVTFLISAFNDNKSAKLILILISCYLSGKAQIGEQFIPLAPNQSEIHMEGSVQRLPPPVLKSHRPDTTDVNNDKAIWGKHVETSVSTKMYAAANNQDAQSPAIATPDSNIASPDRDTSSASMASNGTGNDRTSSSTQMQSQTFDWKATNADRFVNSQCYKLLGFNPFGDLAEQEKRYQECEHEKDMETVKKWAIIGGVVIAVIGLIVWGIKSSRLA